MRASRLDSPRTRAATTQRGIVDTEGHRLRVATALSDTWPLAAAEVGTWACC